MCITPKNNEEIHTFFKSQAGDSLGFFSNSKAGEEGTVIFGPVINDSDNSEGVVRYSIGFK